MYKLFLHFCIIFIPLITLGADNKHLTFLLKFRDNPGTYHIRVQSVKDLIRKYDEKIAQYTILEAINYKIEQTNALDIFQDLIYLPDDAQYIRVSIKKIINTRSKGGGYFFVHTDGLRELAKTIYNYKTLKCAIRVEWQFQYLAKGNSRGCTIGIEGRLK